MKLPQGKKTLPHPPLYFAKLPFISLEQYPLPLSINPNFTQVSVETHLGLAMLQQKSRAFGHRYHVYIFLWRQLTWVYLSWKLQSFEDPLIWLKRQMLLLSLKALGVGILRSNAVRWPNTRLHTHSLKKRLLFFFCFRYFTLHFCLDKCKKPPWVVRAQEWQKWHFQSCHSLLGNVGTEGQAATTIRIKLSLWSSKYLLHAECHW